MSKGVRKTYVIVLVLASSLVAGRAVRTAALVRPAQTEDQSPEQAANASFRDGRYLGELAARRGEQPHLSIGRWASSEDRTSFAAGYVEGYRQGRAAREKTGSDGSGSGLGDERSQRRSGAGEKHRVVRRSVTTQFA